MKTIIKIFLLSLSAVAFFGCEETIELDLEQTPPQYVVDALITNENKEHYVKLSTSVDFYQDEQAPGVSGAQVMVSDNEGNIYQFLESETMSGLYTATFQGKIGNTYTMNIALPEGKMLSAEDKMEAVMEVERLEWAIDEQEQQDPKEEGFFYRLRMYAQEPAETKDYYLFKFYRNDSIQNFNSKRVFVADDKLVAGNIEGLESPEYYRKGDQARFELYRISRDAFLFYNDLSNILNGDGGMTGPSPANPRTNIISSDGLGLGLFQVSAVNKIALVVGQ